MLHAILGSGIGGSGDPRRKWEEMGGNGRKWEEMGEREREREKGRERKGERKVLLLFAK